MFLKAGFISILLSLALAWLLVSVRYLLKVDAQKIDSNQILKAHIDYLLMGILLLVFAKINLSFPKWILYVTVLGAFTNPLLFLVQAFWPRIDKSPFGL